MKSPLSNLKSMNKLLLLILLFSTQIYGQKFEKISADLLSQEFNEIDSSAHAAYIAKDIKMEYNFNTDRIYLVSKYHYIIKIYDEDGEGYGGFEIPLYESGGRKEKVNKIKARTSNLVDGKVVTTELNKKDIYKEETSENYMTTKFELPDVRAGSVIEVSYTLTSPYIYTIPKWHFQNYIPTQSSTYKIKVPSYFVLTPISKGFIPLSVEQKDVVSQHNEVLHTITAANVPPVKEDKYVLNVDDYRSSIKYEIHSTNFPGRSTEMYSKDWNQIAKNFLSDETFGNQLKRKLKATNNIVEHAMTLSRDERLNYIYEYVKSNYTWNEDYGVRSNKGLKTVVENKTGSVGDLNILLINLLRKCEIQSYPLLMRGRWTGLLNYNYPSVTELNYILTYVPYGEGFILLDGSAEYAPPGELPLRAINYSGILISEDGAKVVDIENPNIYSVVNVSNYEIDLEANKLVGQTQKRNTGYAASKFRKKSMESEDDSESEDEADEDDQESDLEVVDLENVYTVTDLKNFKDHLKPIGIVMDEELVNCSKIIDDKIYIDRTLDFGISKNPFTENKRDYPVFYNSKVVLNSVASIVIPEGYEVSAIPEDVVLTLPERIAQFTLTTKSMGGKININYSLKINKTVVMNQNYSALKQMYDLIYAACQEKIVLVRK